MMVLERADAQRAPLKQKLRVIGRANVAMRSVRRPNISLARNLQGSPLTSSRVDASAYASTVSAVGVETSAIAEREATADQLILTHEDQKQAPPPTKRSSGWLSWLFGGAR